MNHFAKTIFFAAAFIAIAAFSPAPASAQDTPGPSELLTQARAYSAQQNFNEASRLYRIIIEFHPDSPLAADSFQELATVYEIQGRLVEAAATLSSLYEKWPDGPLAPQALSGRARILNSMGRSSEAAEVFRLLMRRFPGNTIAASGALQLGTILAAQGKFDEAVIAYQKASSSKNPADAASANRSLAEILFQTGRYYDAEKTIKKVIETEPQNDYYLDMLGRTLSAQNEFARAAAIYEEILKRNPGHPTYEDRLFTAQTKTGKLSGIINALEQAAEKNPQDLASINKLARIYMWQKDSINALRQYEKIFASEPKNYGAGLMLARLYFENQWKKKAADTIGKLLEAAPGDPQALQLLGDILKADGRIDEARDAWERSTGFSTSDQNSYIRLGSLYISKNMIAEATELYERGRAAFNNENLFASDLIFLYRSQMRFKDAVNEYLRVIASGLPAPYRPSEIITLMKSEQLKGESLDITRAWLRKAPDSRPIAQFFAQAAFSLGSPSEALDKLEAYSAAHPAEPDIFLDTAAALQENGEYSSAAQTFAQAASRPGPRLLKSAALAGAARSWLWAGDIPAAASAYQSIIDAYPESPDMPEALFQLAKILMDGGDCSNATIYFKRLSDSYPGDANAGSALLGQARCLIAAGEFSKAEASLETALKTGGAAQQTDEITFLRGETNFFRGMLKESQPYYKRIAESYPESRYINNALERLLFIIDTKDSDTILIQTYMTALRKRNSGALAEAAQLLDGISITMAQTPLAAYAKLELGATLVSLGRDAEAEKTYIALSDDEKNGELFSIALIRAAEIQMKRRPADALRTYQRLLGSDPTSYWAHEAREKLQQLSNLINTGS